MNKKLVLTLISLLILIPPLTSLTIKIGSIAPEHSPWDKALRELGREWRKISNGKIKLKIYPGGISGNEEDMVRKLEIGILDGAVFANSGIAKIYSEFYILSTPFLFNSEKEFLYVAKKMHSGFEKRIEKKGYKVILWSMAGWLYFFSKNTIEYPKDLKEHKLSFTTGEPKFEQVWKKSGYQVIPNDMSELMMGLQTGMVDAFYLSPLLAASGQFFTLAPNMYEMKIAPIYGGLVLSGRIWARIPDQIKGELIHSAKLIAAKLQERIDLLESEAITTMKKHGLKINPVPSDSILKWRKASEAGINSLIKNVFSVKLYKTVTYHIKNYRELSKNPLSKKGI